MKKAAVLSLLIFSIIVFCSRPGKNPFFSEYDTSFQTPPFTQIKESHFMPAFIEGMKQQKEEIEQIIANPAEANLKNTIEALEYSGELLTRVQNVFYNLTSASTNDEIQQISRQVAPLLSKHQDDILLNEKLFQRVKTVYRKKDELNLTPEQGRLLEEYYKDFVRGGANLPHESQTELREINKELSLLSIQFGENVLKEDNSFELVIEKETDLAGLPAAFVAAVAETGVEKGYAGKWVFTLHKPSMMPFLQYSDKRDLREKIFRAYINRGNNENEYDNKKILTRMVALRVRKANLLGYKTHADFVLEENMAGHPDAVYNLLGRLWNPALEKAKREAAVLQEMIRKEGHSFKLQPWDWWYYTEKVKKEKYQLDDETLRPYFKLDNVREGAFMVANKLWGIRFEERKGIPVYHPEVKVFEVKEADGSHLGILYADYHPRASKRGGAWMNAYRKQYVKNGENITPIVTNVFNFTRPAGETPSLLSWDEVSTLFHEFGHALHGLLSNSTYPSLSGTDVPRDFVELPSQIMENWASEPKVLKMYARHYQTGEPIPSELISKIEKSAKFNKGFETVELLAASFLDMDWHTLRVPDVKDVIEFENNSMNKIGLIPEIVVRYRSPYFRHIFAGGYSSGYYSYIWAEVLDADAYQAFRETSLFDLKTAKSFRENILARGGTEDPMVLYKRFRGADPSIEPLLERRGLKN